MSKGGLDEVSFKKAWNNEDSIKNRLSIKPQQLLFPQNQVQQDQSRITLEKVKLSLKKTAKKNLDLQVLQQDQLENSQDQVEEEQEEEYSYESDDENGIEKMQNFMKLKPEEQVIKIMKMKKRSEEDLTEMVNLTSKMQFFQDLNAIKLNNKAKMHRHTCSLLKFVHLPAGRIVFKQEDVADRLYIIIKGSCIVLQNFTDKELQSQEPLLPERVDVQSLLRKSLFKRTVRRLMNLIKFAEDVLDEAQHHWKNKDSLQSPKSPQGGLSRKLKRQKNFNTRTLVDRVSYDKLKQAFLEKTMIDLNRVENQPHFFNNRNKLSHYFCRELPAGHGFGELGLLSKAQRTATVVCKQECYFAYLTANAYSKTIEEIQKYKFQKKLQQLQRFLVKDPFILTENRMKKVMQYFQSQNLNYGTIIQRQNQIQSKIYFIQKGQVLITVDKKEKQLLNEFQSEDQQINWENTIHKQKIYKNYRNFKSHEIPLMTKSSGQMIGFEGIYEQMMREHNFLNEQQQQQQQHQYGQQRSPNNKSQSTKSSYFQLDQNLLQSKYKATIISENIKAFSVTILNLLKVFQEIPVTWWNLRDKHQENKPFHDDLITKKLKFTYNHQIDAHPIVKKESQRFLVRSTFEQLEYSIQKYDEVKALFPNSKSEKNLELVEPVLTYSQSNKRISPINSPSSRNDNQEMSKDFGKFFFNSLFLNKEKAKNEIFLSSATENQIIQKGFPGNQSQERLNIVNFNKKISQQQMDSCSVRDIFMQTQKAFAPNQVFQMQEQQISVMQSRMKQEFLKLKKVKDKTSTKEKLKDETISKHSILKIFNGAMERSKERETDSNQQTISFSSQYQNMSNSFFFGQNTECYNDTIVNINSQSSNYNYEIQNYQKRLRSQEKSDQIDEIKYQNLPKTRENQRAFGQVGDMSNSLGVSQVLTNSSQNNRNINVLRYQKGTREKQFFLQNKNFNLPLADENNEQQLNRCLLSHSLDQLNIQSSSTAVPVQRQNTNPQRTDVRYSNFNAELNHFSDKDMNEGSPNQNDDYHSKEEIRSQKILQRFLDSKIKEQMVLYNHQMKPLTFYCKIMPEDRLNKTHFSQKFFDQSRRNIQGICQTQENQPQSQVPHVFEDIVLNQD